MLYSIRIVVTLESKIDKIRKKSYNFFGEKEAFNLGIKPGPKPVAKTTGKLDKRRRDNKNTPKNHKSLKPSRSSK